MAAEGEGESGLLLSREPHEIRTWAKVRCLTLNQLSHPAALQFDTFWMTSLRTLFSDWPAQDSGSLCCCVQSWQTFQVLSQTWIWIWWTHFQFLTFVIWGKLCSFSDLYLSSTGADNVYFPALLLEPMRTDMNRFVVMEGGRRKQATWCHAPVGTLGLNTQSFET